MTDRELMQRALDALEALFGKQRQDLPTVNALRERLAQPKKTCCNHDCNEGRDCPERKKD
jgi:hypothetical protein